MLRDLASGEAMLLYTTPESLTGNTLMHEAIKVFVSHPGSLSLCQHYLCVTLLSTIHLVWCIFQVACDDGKICCIAGMSVFSKLVRWDLDGLHKLECMVKFDCSG